MAFAIIATGGKQYLVAKGTVLSIEKLQGAKEGDSVTFDSVLLSDDDKTTEIGTPALSGKKVTAKVLEAGKGEKKLVVRYKQKSRYHKKKGHRQPFLKVKIESI